MLTRVVARTLMLGAVAVGLWSASAAASTPVSDSAATICPALGGSPA